MTNRFLMSVAAAALIAGTGFANAQGTGTSREPTAGPSVQQNAPSEQTKPSSGMKATQSDEKAAQPGGAKSQRAQDNMKAGAKSEKSAQDNNIKGEKSKGMSSENEGAKGGKDMKAEGREGQKSNMNAQTREGQKSNMNAEQKGAAEGSKSQTTTGQSKQTGQSTQSPTGQTAPQSQTGQTTTQSQTGTSVQSQTTGQAGAAAKLSTEQRTQITTVIRSQRVQPLTNVNFSIVVGTRVPRDVRFHPLPREVVTIYPEWRGYEFVLVRDQILVIDPRTFEIVAILEA